MTVSAHSTNRRLQILAEANSLLSKPNFGTADRSKFESLLQMADALGTITSHDLQRANAMQRRTAGSYEDTQTAAFRHFLIGGKTHLSQEERDLLAPSEHRDLTGGGAYPGSASGFFSPMGFYERLTAMMKAFDRLFDENVSTIVDTDTGSPFPMPNVNDTAGEATVVEEGGESTPQDPAALGSLNFPKAATWRSGIVLASREIDQDSALNFDNILADIFGVRFARGIGKAAVATLLSAAASSGQTVLGNDNSANPDPTAEIGYFDLLNLIGSVDSAYVASPKAGWLMTFGTLLSLLKLKDKAGRPVLPVTHNAAGDFTIFEKPVYLSPSMDSLGAGKKPITFGALDRFCVRRVKGSRVMRYEERWVELYKVGFESFMRVNYGLQLTEGADSPVKYIEQPEA